jgi:hypothetical protein
VLPAASAACRQAIFPSPFSQGYSIAIWDYFDKDNILVDNYNIDAWVF